MDVRLLRRPVVDLVFSRPQCLLAGNVVSRRLESSYRRTKKLLNIRPDDTFTFTKSSPSQDQMIFNPPPAAPSVLHTPLTFLPKDDKRRKLFETARPSALSVQVGPALGVKPKGYQKHHLTEEDVEEMRRLRAADPDKWTVSKLARKFNTTSLFVRICTQNKDRYEANIKAKEAKVARMGPRRKKAREDRAKRWEQIYRDE